MENKEKTLAELDAARLKIKQYENKIQLLENRKRHLEKKAARQHTHHLCKMSFIALYPRDWKMRNYLSLGGVGSESAGRVSFRTQGHRNRLYLHRLG